MPGAGQQHGERKLHQSVVQELLNRKLVAGALAFERLFAVRSPGISFVDPQARKFERRIWSGGQDQHPYLLVDRTKTVVRSQRPWGSRVDEAGSVVGEEAKGLSSRYTMRRPSSAKTGSFGVFFAPSLTLWTSFKNSSKSTAPEPSASTSTKHCLPRWYNEPRKVVRCQLPCC